MYTVAEEKDLARVPDSDDDEPVRSFSNFMQHHSLPMANYKHAIASTLETHMHASWNTHAQKPVEMTVEEQMEFVAARERKALAMQQARVELIQQSYKPLHPHIYKVSEVRV